MGRKCTATRVDGEPCQAWSKSGTVPARCFHHASSVPSDREDPNAERKPSIYDRGYTLEEIADLVHLALDHSLDDDLAAVRIAVRRVLQQLKEELSPDEYANLARVIFFGSNAIARLVRTSRDLAESRSDEIQEAIRKAVKEKGQDKKARQ